MTDRADGGGSFDATTATDVAPVEPVAEVAAETPAASPPPVDPISQSIDPIPQPAPEAPAPEPVPPTSPTQTSSSTETPSIKSRLSQAFEGLRFKKRAKLDKIVQLVVKKRSIKNDDVEKLLRVSDSTAARYLKQLVQEGRLRATKASNDAYYEPV